MLYDDFGQETSLDSPEILATWNAAQRAYFAHSAQTPTHLGATLEAAPHFTLGHAVQGIFCLLLGRRELVDTARTALSQARAHVGAVTARERHYVEALDAWLGGRPTAAIDHMEAVLRDAPNDPLAVKFSHAIRFILGDAPGMRASLERVLPAYGHDHPATGYVMGCYAFALEETGDYARAEQVGRGGLALAPDDAWGLHAVAHVYEMTVNHTDGLAWLSDQQAAWSHCNNFRCHLWWHMALMHLSFGRHDTVLQLYDDRIRRDRTDDYRDIADATSLLTRLELEGVAVGHRWAELAERAAARVQDGCLIFADLHYMLALMGSGRTDVMRELEARIRRDATTGEGDMADRMGAPGVAAAAGVRAFAEGDHRTAFQHLVKARETLRRAGGSHAQRDVFERLTIDSAIRADLLDDAANILAARTRLCAGREDGYAVARNRRIAEVRAAGLRSAPVSADPLSP